MLVTFLVTEFKNICRFWIMNCKYLKYVRQKHSGMREKISQEIKVFSILLANHFTHLLTYLLTYLLIPWCGVLLEKLAGLQLVKKFPPFHGTRRLITALTSVRHPSLSWAYPIQSIYPHPTSWRSILLLSTHLRLGFPCDLFPSGFPTKTLYTTLSSPIRATSPAHLILQQSVISKTCGTCNSRNSVTNEIL